MQQNLLDYVGLHGNCPLNSVKKSNGIRVSPGVWSEAFKRSVGPVTFSGTCSRKVSCNDAELATQGMWLSSVYESKKGVYGHAGNLETKPRNRERSEIDMSKPNWREETCL